MKTLIVSALLLAACSKQNPNVCCTDAANCAAQGLSSEAMCAAGLLCRGNTCVAETCVTSDECELGAPFCASSGLCSATCDTDAECPGFGGAPIDAYCSMGMCVECRTSADCSGVQPICDGGSCRACAADSECDSSVCGDDGSCVSSDKIVYVDPAGADSGTCTQASPCQGLVYAITKASPSRFDISMALGVYQGPLEISHLSADQLDIHGHGATLTQPAGNDGDVLQFFSGYQLVTLRDLIITLATNSGRLLQSDSPLSLVAVKAINGTNCIDAEAGLTARNVLVENCATTGLFSQEGSMLDNIEVSGGALGLDFDGSVSARNVLVHDTSGLGVQFRGGASGSITFATIVNASNSSGALAVNCIPNVAIVSSIVWAPSLSAQLPVTGCSLSNTIVGPTAISGAPNTDPSFVGLASKDYHLAAGSPAIDVVTTGPAVDLDGTPRPQGPKFDIGAYEYKP